MGEPIRWDTIMSRPNSEAVAGINSAAGLINNGFSQLTGVMQRGQDNEAANFANHTKINTSAFLDAVSKYQNPDEIKAAMQSGGALDQLRASLGPNINNDQIRGAAEARVLNLQQGKMQDITFNNAMTDEATAGAVQAYKAARLNNDEVGMKTALDTYQAKNGRDLSSLIAYGDARGWELKNREMTTQNQNDQHLSSVSGIQHQRAMEGIGRIQADAAAQSAATQGKLANFQIETGTQDRKTAQAAGMAAALKASLSATGNMYAEGMYTGNNADELRKFMKDNNVGDGNSNRQAEVINYLSDILKTGVEIKGPDGKVVRTLHEIPMSAVKQAIGGATNDFWNWGINTAPAKNMETILKGILTATNKDADGNLVSKALNDLAQYTDATNRVTENAPAISPSRIPTSPYGSGKRK